MEKFILITGASSGLGAQTALTLAEKGFRVFAGVRKEEDKKAVESKNPLIKAVFLDVTSDESVNNAYEEITKETNVLHALVNNAGIAVASPVECIPIEAVKNQFEINVYGAIRVAQKFLPLLNNSPNPRIVNISSMASFGIFPFISPYCASKRALDIFFNALYLESKNPELKIISIKPGVVKTKIWDKSIASAEEIIKGIPEEYRDKYKKENDFLIKNAKKNNDKGLEPSSVADLVHKTITIKNPKPSYCIGSDSKIAELSSKLPLCILNFITKNVMKKRI